MTHGVDEIDFLLPLFVVNADISGCFFKVLNDETSLKKLVRIRIPSLSWIQTPSIVEVGPGKEKNSSVLISKSFSSSACWPVSYSFYQLNL